MYRLLLIVLALSLASLPLSRARAQVTVDVAKITCKQFAEYKITNPRNIALWLSGYYNGKKNNTIIDTQKMVENSDKLTRYCLANPTVMVMQAVEKMFGVNP
jgi:acid stress chaperone HdeB